MIKVFDKIFKNQAQSAVIPEQKALSSDENFYKRNIKITPAVKTLDEKTMTLYLISAGKYGGQQVLNNLKINAVFGGFDKKITKPLSKRAEWLINTVDETTKEEMARIVSAGFEAGLSRQEIKNQIVNRFSEISYARAEMIVHAETANAISKVSIITAKQNGIKKKEWITSNDDLVSDGCMENQDAGAIPIEDSFPSGDQAPPRHPRCRCYVQEVIPDDYINTDPYIG